MDAFKALGPRAQPIVMGDKIVGAFTVHEKYGDMSWSQMDLYDALPEIEQAAYQGLSDEGKTKWWAERGSQYPPETA